jgi:hypothetical protein
MLRLTWQRYRDWAELRKAEARYKMHFRAQEDLPYEHWYSLLESDKEVIARSLKGKL